MAFCVLEPPSKKMIYFISFIIFMNLKNILEEKINEIFKDRRAKYFEFTILYSLGDLLSGFFALIVKKRTNSEIIVSKQKNKKKVSSNKINLAEKNELIYKKKDYKIEWISIKRVLYLSIFDLLAQSCSIVYAFIYHNEKFKLFHHNKNLSLIFDIISRFILNKLLLKIEFYPHYYLSISISIISFSILSISDLYYMLIESEFSHWIYLGNTILKTVFYSFENVEGKIGLNSEFLNPYNLLFYKGVMQSIFLIFASLIFIIFRQYYLFTGLFDNKEYNFNFKTVIFVLLYLILNMLVNISTWKIIDSFTVQHITIARGGSSFISYIRALIQNKLDYQKKERKINSFYFTNIFGYILLFIGTLIHNEIIILNCCGFDIYTYKKLKEREAIDLQTRNDTENTLSDDESIKPPKILSSKETIKSTTESQDYKYMNSLNDSIEF